MRVRGGEVVANGEGKHLDKIYTSRKSCKYHSNWAGVVNNVLNLGFGGNWSSLIG